MSCVIYIMGVVGSGKLIIGGQFVEVIGFFFYDGDDFYFDVNVEKMIVGQLLMDEDWVDWLVVIYWFVFEKFEVGQFLVLACFVLKAWYRAIFSVGIEV